MRSEWTVLRIIDGDTIEVSPSWQWGNFTGTRVKILGYNPNKYGVHNHYLIKRHLESLISFKKVVLDRPMQVMGGDLLCEVYLNGVNIADHFPAYRG